ncbi:MAG TPA: hypothetical protein VLF66_19575 [Thermoanaerobaculia bacterium]|nr:hypothetical protein [Thermoanaerobaculia bacterium]
MRTLALVSVLSLSLAFSLAHPAAAGSPPLPQSYEVELAPVGGSDVTGTAHLVLRGERLSVILRAFGLDPGKVHPTIIHGFPGGRASICPDAAPAVEESSSLGKEDDVRRVFGLDLLGLDPSPEADLGGVATFQHGYDVEPRTIEPLARRTLVLYHASGTPIACGEIRTYPSS